MSLTRKWEFFLAEDGAAGACSNALNICSEINAYRLNVMFAIAKYALAMVWEYVI